ncbi:hypothetical protein ACIGGF_18325 [Rhodococcus sp. NPDC078407]|uniref:hypothetical protein n=1 Tax=Rhodococcus sp. NPDC078407 TaxID=3364509 RepID=UPI0037C9655E
MLRTLSNCPELSSAPFVSRPLANEATVVVHVSDSGTSDGDPVSGIRVITEPGVLRSA